MSPALVRAAGAALVLASFVPVERIFGSFGQEMSPRVGPGEWLLGLFVFGASAWLIARLWPTGVRGVAVGLRRLDARLSTGVLLPGLVLTTLALVLILTSILVFRHRPLLVDSVVQLFQAEIFASGRLTAPAPPLEAFVATQHMLVREAGWFAQYPPGHAALLAVGAVANMSWIVPVLLSLGTASLMYRFVSDAWDRQTARLSLVLLLLSPFFWVMGASFMNHVTCLFFAAAFLVCFQRWERGDRAAWALLAGLALGAAGLARPLTAVSIAAVFAPVGLVVGVRDRRYGSVALAGVGGLAGVALYMGFNAMTTGAPLVPGYLELWGASHGIGFHESPWGLSHTPWTGLRNQLIDLSNLAAFFLEWPIPALLPAGLYAALTGGRDGWERRMVAGLMAIPLIHLFYWHRDAYLGPRFLYSGLLFLVPLTARGLLAIRELPTTRFRLRQSVFVGVVLSFAYSALYATPRRVSAYETSMASMKLDLPSRARAAGIERGVVFVAVSWGNRLLARMRGSGVSASTAERVYRRADHCTIEQLLRRGMEEAWGAVRIESALRSLPSEGEMLDAASPNGDPTLRLVPGRPLAPVCRDELAHDAAGYGNWLPFLPANDPALENPVLYVRDLRDLNADFLASRPNREAWLFRPGRLERIESR